jgi:F420-0:gamma-glutamyl ligase
MRKPDGAPVVLIRGYDRRAGDSSARALLRKPELDLFR